MANHLTPVQRMSGSKPRMAYGFGIIDDRGGTAKVWFLYRTEPEAEAARAKVEEALSTASEVLGPP